MDTRRNRRSTFLPDPYIHPDHLPDPKLQYVAWLDLMGTSSMMEYSFEISATNLCKLHLYVYQQENFEQFGIYPMNDGLYITSDSYQPLERLLCDVFTDLGKVITSEFNQDHWDILTPPIFRAAIAYGPLYHPKEIHESSLVEYPYKSSILLGKPIVSANRLESQASPFGIIVDESINEAEDQIRWWNDNDLARLIYLLFDEYTRTCSESTKISYPESARKEHLRKANEYLIR